jgi:GH18 family chitinase
MNQSSEGKDELSERPKSGKIFSWVTVVDRSRICLRPKLWQNHWNEIWVLRKNLKEQRAKQTRLRLSVSTPAIPEEESRDTES